VDVGAFNGPHRGTKGEMYEGGSKIPCLVRWSNRIVPGTQTDAQAVLMDFFPTILEATGSKVDATGYSADGIFQQRIDGVSLCGLLLGKTDVLPERSLYFVRREGGLPFAGKTNSAVIRGNWKILQNTPFSPMEFYDLRNDPFKKDDLRTTAPAQFWQMTQQWMLHIQEGGRTPWQPPRD
jgi:arylsulfatase A-like enzyme